MNSLPTHGLRPAEVRERLLGDSPQTSVTFAAGKRIDSGDGAPAAVVLCCSDFQELPERVLGEALGPIYAVQAAGALVTPTVGASLRYALETTGARLLVVLGHTRCRLVEHCWHQGPAPSVLEGLLAPGFEVARRQSDASLSGAVSSTNRHNAHVALELVGRWEASLGHGVAVVQGLYDEGEHKVTLSRVGKALRGGVKDPPDGYGVD